MRSTTLLLLLLGHAFDVDAAPGQAETPDETASAYRISEDVVGKTTLNDFRARYRYTAPSGKVFPTEMTFPGLRGVSRLDLRDGPERNPAFKVGEVTPYAASFDFVDGELAAFAVNFREEDTDAVRSFLIKKFGEPTSTEPGASSTWDNGVSRIWMYHSSVGGGGYFKIHHHHLNNVMMSRFAAAVLLPKS